MALAVFMTDKRREEILAEKMIQEALELWRRNATEYKTLPSRYHDLLEKKRQAQIKPLRKLSNEVLADYPKIPLLEFDTEEQAYKAICEWSKSGELGAVIENTRFLLGGDYVYSTLKNWVNETKYLFLRTNYQMAKKKAIRNSISYYL